MPGKRAIDKRVPFTVDDLFASEDERIYALGFVTSVPLCKTPILDVLCYDKPYDTLHFKRMFGNLMKGKQQYFGKYDRKTKKTRGTVGINDLCVVELDHLGCKTASGMPKCHLHYRIDSPDETRRFVANLKSSSKRDLTPTQLAFLDKIHDEIVRREIAGKCDTSSRAAIGEYEFILDSDDKIEAHIDDLPPGKCRMGDITDDMIDDMIDDI